MNKYDDGFVAEGSKLAEAAGVKNATNRPMSQATSFIARTAVICPCP